MHSNYRPITREDIIHEVQELEDAYADALADEVDARSLSALWERIKMLKREVDEHVNPAD